MRLHVGHLLLCVAILSAASTAFAQQHVVTGSPPSGYDPFWLNHYTGRFEYVPIPYDPQPPGSSYNPFRFNWHSGQWDYVSSPLLSDYAGQSRETAASTYLDTRIDPQQLGSRTSSAPQPAPPIATTLMPPPINPHLPRTPATKPATAPANRPPTRQEQLARLATLGHWEFNYTTSRWIFVLPPD